MANFKTIAFWAMIFFIICLGLYLISWTKSESFACMSNPYTYSIKLLEEANGAQVVAIVNVMKPGSNSVVLTREGFALMDGNIISNISNYTFQKT